MAKALSKTTKMAAKHATLGFGVPATSDPHHFKVIIPKSSTGKVKISEYLGLQAQNDKPTMIERALLERPRWTAIRAEVQRAFNVRLKSYNLKTSAWQIGDNMVDRLLGKELCVLAWAVEGMDIENIPLAVRNWLALRPEERWWLFGMTAKSTGGIEERDIGWRIALRHALGDIVQTEQTELNQANNATNSNLIAKSRKIESSEANYESFAPSSSSSLLPECMSNNQSLSRNSCTSTASSEIEQRNSDIEETLFLFEAKQAKAIGHPVGDMSSPEFLVKKGSTANIAQAKSLRPAIRELRQQLLDDGILIKQGDIYSFSHEYLFKSPSSAACVIAGNPRSGMDAWRDLQGNSLKTLGYGKKS